MHFVLKRLHKGVLFWHWSLQLWFWEWHRSHKIWIKQLQIVAMLSLISQENYMWRLKPSSFKYGYMFFHFCFEFIYFKEILSGAWEVPWWFPSVTIFLKSTWQIVNNLCTIISNKEIKNPTFFSVCVCVVCFKFLFYPFLTTFH
jgi:hypothetical protein